MWFPMRKCWTILDQTLKFLSSISLCSMILILFQKFVIKKNIWQVFWIFSVQFSSIAQLCSTLCDPRNCSTPGLPVHHKLPESTQTHVHQVGDAIQPSHPLFPFSSCPQSFPASGSFQMSQLFASGGQNIGVSASTSVLPINCLMYVSDRNVAALFC